MAFVGSPVPTFASYSRYGRQAFHPLQGSRGVSRLDGRTGAVSLCMRPESGWACTARLTSDPHLKMRLRALRKNATKKTVLGRGEPLPGLPPRPPADVGVEQSP